MIKCEREFPFCYKLQDYKGGRMNEITAMVGITQRCI